MPKKLAFCFLVMLVGSFSGFIYPGYSQPSQPLPAVVGSKTIPDTSLITEFFTQPPPDDWKGDIAGFALSDTYWVYITGIDASGVTGPAGRQIQFNLQDAEDGSSFRRLGISFSLENPSTGDFLECYQSFGDVFQEQNEGRSTHGLGPGKLTSGKFDLRFLFTKTTSPEPWNITPYFRLSSGNWTVFLDSTFTTDVAFDFKGAKLVVAFTKSAADTVSFDNFFVIGPPKGPITEVFVDDNWNGLSGGDVVQFPGQENIQIMGFDAFATIQEGIDAFQGNPSPKFSTINSQLSGILAGEVNIAAGVYHENLILEDHVNLTGAGSGTDSTIATIIKAAQSDSAVITINSITASGSSVSNRLELRDLRVSGANGNSPYVSGILIIEGGIPPVPPLQTNQTFSNFANNLNQAMTQHILFESVAAVNNQGSGINMVQPTIVEDIVVNNCILSDNLESGLRFTDEPVNFDGLTITGGLFENNGLNGVTNSGLMNPMIKVGNQNSNIANSQNQTLIASTLTNIHINGTTFSGNGGPHAPLNSGDISIYYLTGDASFTNVTITGDSAHVGLAIHGVYMGPPIPAGNISLDGVTINGKYQYPNITGMKTMKLSETSLTDVGAGLIISDFSDVRAISFSKVQIDVSPVSPQLDVVNLFIVNADSTLDIGDTILGENADLSILNLAIGDMDATSATFTNAAADNFTIEDRVTHVIDLNDVGLVRWIPKNVYVTRNSYVDPATAASILRVIDAASAGDTVNVAAGNFWIWADPQIFINKNLTLIGAGKENTIIRPNYDTGDTGDSKGWFLIESPAELHVRDITFDGTNYQINQAFRHRGQGSFTNVGFNEIKYNASGPDFAGTGIVAGDGSGPVNVTNCTFTNMGRAGIKYNKPAANGSVFSGNSYTGKGNGSWLDYAVEISAGANVTVSGNTISNNLGVVSPEDSSSAGVLVTDSADDGTKANINKNAIYNCASAVHVGLDSLDNSFVVTNKNNFYSNGNGIFVASALVIIAQEDTIQNNLDGIDLNYVTWFDIDHNEIFDNNNGVLIANSIGELDNNIIHNNTLNGITILDDDSQGTTVNNNEFCNNVIYGVENKRTSPINATANWWGSSDGPGGAGSGLGDSVSTSVDFSSFLTSSIFANSPCPEPAVLVAAKIFLQGPYNSSTDEMSTALSDNDLIPLTSPYSEDPRTATNIPNNVVDWVLVELRETDNGPTVASRSAFLHKDGRIVADDGTTGEISLNPIAEGNYYIVIKHRNHLSIMSANTVTLSSSSSTLYDFTTGQSQGFGSTPMTEIDTDVFGMRSGDGNGDGGVDASDKNQVWRDQNGTAWSYSKLGDFNLDGGIDATDSNLFWRTNNGTATQVPGN